MKRPLKILALVLAAVVVLVLAGAAGGYVYWFQRPQPLVNGTLAVQGITDVIEIVRDEQGVPHIFARNAADAYFAQGYVHAQDRLWQMEFNRRVSAGRLSEVLGSATLDNDLYLRTLGFRRIAEQEWSMADAGARAQLEAYARGVNAFVATHQDNLPVEFSILGFKPEPWTPVDSIAWGKVMALSLSGNMDSELRRMQLIAKIGPARWSEIEPQYPQDGPFIVDQRVPAARDGGRTTADDLPAWSSLVADASALEPLARLHSDTRLLALGMQDVPADPTQIFGSNNWVIAGSRTTTGKPILANDPHLGIQMPSIWYEVHLSGGPLDVSGVSFPGTPGVVIGHNARIAWGFTNVGSDVQDLYVEHPNPLNPAQFEWQGQWENAQVFREQINVKGAAPVTKDVYVTRHGPVMTDVLGQWHLTQTLALRWTALEPGHTIESILKLDEAANWEQFRAALRLFAVPSQNVVYADVDGNIGYQMPGWLPIRAKGDGAVPVPGWTGEYEWKGYVPFDELPRAFNPPSGFIATANNQVAPPGYAYFIGKEFAPPYRAQRIVDLINAKPKLSLDDVRAMQADTYAIPAKSLQRLIADASPASDLARKAQAVVRDWDTRYDEASPAPLVVELFMRRVLSDTFADELGDTYGDYGLSGLPVFIRLAESDPDNVWFDDVNTADRKENLHDILDRALSETGDDLAQRYGSDPAGWSWGKVHLAVFAHPLGSVQPLDRIFNLTTGAGGGSYTVRNASVSGNMRVGSISSFREIVDLGDLSRSQIQNSHGQSGLPAGKHFDDQLQNWRNVVLYPMWFTRADVDAHQEGTLRLTPQ